MSTSMPLEGDGLIDNLFHFLWSKDDFNAGPRIFVPHTIVYKNAQPIAWYFTSIKTGKIKRKNKANLTNLQIKHEFTKYTKQLEGRNSFDIVACYLYQSPSTAHIPTSDDTNQEPVSTIIEYFDEAALHDFLFAREKVRDGILQRFILPKGTHNTTIRAIWSPKICLLERRVNTKSLYDPRYSVYERGVTFDGGGAGELFSRPEPVRGAMLPGEVQLLCEQVVDHVTQVSYHKYRISRMVLHLKSDADDRLWLLWCSSLRVLRANVSGSEAMVRPLGIALDAQVPPHISLGQTSHRTPLSPPAQRYQLRGNGGRQQLKDNSIRQQELLEAPVRDGFQRCTSCARVVEQRRMLTTNFKAVLEHFYKFLLFLRLHLNEKEQIAIEWPPDQRLVEAAGGVGFGILPFCDRVPITATAPTSTSPSVSRTHRQKHLAGLNAKELIIPPIIQYLHPTLAVEDFERHRQDPIFLHKLVAVCESCCLVYSDYSTAALEVNSLRPNVPAILRPQREVNDLKRRLDPIDPISMTAVNLGQIRPTPVSKPPPSAWKPISKPTRNRSSPCTLTHCTINALPPVPRLPDRIDSLTEFISSAGNNTDGDNSPGQREESFFRGLYHNHEVGEGHPLNHMLVSSEKLSRVAQAQKKQFTAIREGAKADWVAYGKSASTSGLEKVLNKKREKNPYSVVLHASGFDTRKPRKHKQARKEKHNRQGSRFLGDQHDFAWMQELEDASEESPSKSKPKNKSPQHIFISTRETLAAEAHQEFLFAALHDAQVQLEELSSLTPLTFPPTPATTNGKVGNDEMPKEAATIEELQSLLSDNASLSYEVDEVEASSTQDET